MQLYPNYYKKISPRKYKKKICLVNIRTINLSFDKLRLIAQIRNISDYKFKSKEDLIKVLSKPEAKPQAPKPQAPKPETKPKQTSKPKPKIEVKVNKKR